MLMKLHYNSAFKGGEWPFESVFITVYNRKKSLGHHRWDNVLHRNQEHEIVRKLQHNHDKDDWGFRMVHGDMISP